MSRNVKKGVCGGTDSTKTVTNKDMFIIVRNFQFDLNNLTAPYSRGLAARCEEAVACAVDGAESLRCALPPPKRPAVST